MSHFQGFLPETLDFMSKLTTHNNREWFDRHRSAYEVDFKEPAFSFISEMGSLLAEVRPEIQAQPRIDGSLFRLNRDVRFSPNKAPYKTHMGILLWEGSRKRMENSGFYFHLEPEKLLLGAGLYMMPRHMIKPFRDAVASDDLGKKLLNVVNQLEATGYTIGTEHYKRTPRDYDPDCPGARFLRFNGLSAIIDMPVPDAVFTRDILQLALSHFQVMTPLHEWLLKAMP